MYRRIQKTSKSDQLAGHLNAALCKTKIMKKKDPHICATLTHGCLDYKSRAGCREWDPLPSAALAIVLRVRAPAAWASGVVPAATPEGVTRRWRRWAHRDVRERHESRALGGVALAGRGIEPVHRVGAPEGEDQD